MATCLASFEKRGGDHSPDDYQEGSMPQKIGEFLKAGTHILGEGGPNEYAP
jgi:hypothetical protein